MKTSLLTTFIVATSLCASLAQTNNANYTNFIRQIQLPDVGVQRDASVDAAGQQASPLEINPGGARFELHTVRTSPLQSYLLDTKYVGTYVPLAVVGIRTQDTNSLTPRTRADRPFYVDVAISGLLSGATDPEASKSVKFLRHTQSYGTGGDGIGIDRTQATLASQVTVNQNGTQTYTYTLTGIAGADRAKIRGEERFTVFSQADYQVPESQLAGQTIQIWPVADGTIAGIAQGELIRFNAPTVTLSINDIYPESGVYAQVYRGAKRDDGFVGTIVPGSAVVINESVPQNRLLVVSGWDSILTADGVWTMELLTSTVFGIDRLSWVTFNVDRTVSVNASVTTIE
ncbi:MAG: hypothetical protein H7Y36_08010 [Armatimonadetes bacterium]|nr:hypothetical protein [Akkermansiaceae bacterium]